LLQFNFLLKKTQLNSVLPLEAGATSEIIRPLAKVTFARGLITTKRWLADSWFSRLRDNSNNLYSNTVQL